MSTDEIESCAQPSSSRLFLSIGTGRQSPFESLSEGRLSKLGEIIVDSGPLSAEDTDTTSAAVGLLQKLGFIERTPEWPSHGFGPVLPNVLEELKRAYRILTTTGFEVIGDPLNPLGDGRSWVLRCEPTRSLPDNCDIADLAYRCLLAEGIKVAVKPVWDKNTLLVALWESAGADTSETQHANSSRPDRKCHDATADAR